MIIVPSFRQIRTIWLIALIAGIFLINIYACKDTIADTLVAGNLSERSQLSGTMLELRNGLLSFLCDDGSIANVYWRDLRTLHSDDKLFITLDSQETVLGRINVKDGKIYIDSQSMGEMAFDSLRVVSIERKKREMPGVFTVSAPQEMASVRGRGKPTMVARKDREARSEEKKITQPASEKQTPTIGEKPAPEINPEEMFLRQDKVLIPQGKAEIELNLAYNNIDRSATLLGPDKVRSLTQSVTARYGITNTLMGFATVPFVMNWRETQPAATEPTQNSRTSGLGDISFGLNYQLLSETLQAPSLMLSLTAKSRTGGSPYISEDGAEATGTGHWSISPGFSLVRTVDPVVMFGSLYYTYVFPKRITGPLTIEEAGEDVESKPGDSINLMLGAGFSFNEKASLAFKVLGSFIARDRIAGNDIGETRTPFYFYSNLDYALSKHSYIEPTVGFGITKDAQNLTLALSYVYRFY